MNYIMEIKGIKGDLEQINYLMDKIGLMPKKEALCNTLSG